MKKVLIVFDGWHFSEGAMDFARRLNEMSPILLTGVFMPSVDYSDTMTYYLGGMAGPIFTPIVDADPGLKEQNIAKFQELCQKHGIEYRVHDVTGGKVIKELSKETRFADLMILSSETFYENLGQQTSEEYLEDTLHNAECPVLLIPEKYDFPENIIMAYDGSRSSVYAIKQFTYLFPEWLNTNALLVHASVSQSEIPDLPYIEEYAARHFNNLTIFNLEAEPKKYFGTWMSGNGISMLVAGSFGRSFVSEAIKKNFIKDVIEAHKLPIFIAHR